MNKSLILLTLVLTSAASSLAGTAIADSKKVVVAPVDGYLFNANEWQIDAFVAGAAGRFNHSNYNGLGGGLGLSYFFTRYFGIGIDDTLGELNARGGNLSNHAYDNFSGNLIARLPIESWHLAPYGFAGGGATWGNHATAGNGDVGVGLDYRFTKNFGVFIDSRYLYGSRSLSETLSRAGVRFAF